MAAKPPAGGGKAAGLTRNRWLLVGGAVAVGLLVFFYLRSRSSSSTPTADVGGSSTGADTGDQSPYIAGTPDTGDGGQTSSGSSSSSDDVLSALLASENQLVGGAFATEGQVIGSQQALIGELGTGALSLAQTSEMQLGSIASSAVGGLVGLATQTPSIAAPAPYYNPGGPEIVAPSAPSVTTGGGGAHSAGPAAGYASNAPSALTTARQSAGRGPVLQ